MTFINLKQLKAVSAFCRKSDDPEVQNCAMAKDGVIVATDFNKMIEIKTKNDFEFPKYEQALHVSDDCKKGAIYIDSFIEELKIALITAKLKKTGNNRTYVSINNGTIYVTDEGFVSFDAKILLESIKALKTMDVLCAEVWIKEDKAMVIKAYRGDDEITVAVMCLIE